MTLDSRPRHSPDSAAASGRETALDSIAETLSFAPLLHFRVGLGAELAVEVDSRSRSPLYVATGATCYLRHESGHTVEIRHGDVVLLPHGGRHRVYVDAQAPAVPLAKVFERRRSRKGLAFALDIAGDDCVMSGSFFWTRDFASHPLMVSLPPVLHLVGDGSDLEWLAPTVALMRWMSDLNRGGGVGMAETANVLIRHLVLAHLRDAGTAVAAAAEPGGRLRDERLLPALKAIHTRPRDPWTVDTLAAACNMGRTAFAVRFQAQTGQPPARYLARWRVHLAARLLREKRISLDQAAEHVGYSSGSILARAYKRQFGLPPSGDLPVGR